MQPHAWNKQEQNTRTCLFGHVSTSKERTEEECTLVPNGSRKEEVTMIASEAAKVWKASHSADESSSPPQWKMVLQRNHQHPEFEKNTNSKKKQKNPEAITK